MKKENSKDIINKLSKKSFIEKQLSRNLRKKEIKEKKFHNLKISVFVSALILFTTEVYITNLFFSLITGIITFITVFFILTIIPILENKRKVAKIESELPFFLIKLVTEINLGNSFFVAIEKICEKNGYVENEFKKIISDMKKGKSFEESVQEINHSLNSLEVKRALSSITNIYSRGGDSRSLKRLTEELFLKQRIASKEFSGKMVIYSLIFIVISAIVPAMFSSFILIGSYFMAIEFSAIQVFLIIIVIFPALNIMILMIINSKTPLFLKG